MGGARKRVHCDCGSPSAKSFFGTNAYRTESDGTIAILIIRWVNDGVEQQTQRVYENMGFLLDLLARVIAMRILFT
jgi:hypothetical protein